MADSKENTSGNTQALKGPFGIYETNRVLNSVSQLLKNRIFSGCYTERRLVEVGTLSAYKDVIVVDKSEHEILKILTTANDLLNNHFKGRVTSCVSGSRNSYSIWTDLTGVAFGSHWFLIKNITLNNNIISVAVKCLRPINSEPSQCASSVPSFDWETFNIDPSFVKKAAQNVLQVITVENVMSSVRFLIVLFLTLLVGSYRMLQLLLKGFHELNYFVQTFTPIILACIESITKAFGGLLILIAMKWKNKGDAKTIQNSPPRPLTYTGRRWHSTYQRNDPPSSPYAQYLTCQQNSPQSRPYTQNLMYRRNNQIIGNVNDHNQP